MQFVKPYCARHSSQFATTAEVRRQTLAAPPTSNMNDTAAAWGSAHRYGRSLIAISVIVIPFTTKYLLQ
jgi:hypothetical protein